MEERIISKPSNNRYRANYDRIDWVGRGHKPKKNHPFKLKGHLLFDKSEDKDDAFSTISKRSFPER